MYVGTSGWQYAHWRERFYPRGLPQRLWLSFFARRFQTVEVNNTFYRLPQPASFAAWAAATPPDFIFALKMSRFLTHMKRLRDPEPVVRRFLGAARGLKTKMGPVLLQLSASHQADAGRLAAALEAFPRRSRVAVELRHPSWQTPEVRRVLENRGTALCLADRGGPLEPSWVTADWGYVRFHGGLAQPPSGYGRRSLSLWADRLTTLWGPRADVFIFFNNDAFGCAVRDATVLAAALRADERPASRVPPARDVHVV